MEFLIEYGLFLAKAITVVVAILVVAAFIIGASQRQKSPDEGHIEVKNLNEALDGITQNLKNLILNPQALKIEAKEEKKKTKELNKSQKQDAKAGVSPRSRLFVIDFLGDLQASAVTNLREEITAVLSIASESDEVLIRLESPGGVVHGYGLAASQLLRIRSKGIPLTVAVDKVAASGGYLMACIGSRIIAAPFAILGSIGVVAQMPNFHRLLKKNDVDVEILTAGQYKRTLTVFGENTDAGREKFKDELEDVHRIFKDFVTENRPVVDIEKVATGEAWYGRRALEQALVDELKTSDEYIIEQCQERDAFEVRYVLHKNKIDKLFERVVKVFSSTGLQSTLRLPPGAQV